MTEKIKIQKYKLVSIGKIQRINCLRFTSQHKVMHRVFKLVISQSRHPKQPQNSDEIQNKYYELSALKVAMNETRQHLNEQIRLNKNHLNEETLDLSRKLDILIYQYTTLEMEVKALVE